MTSREQYDMSEYTYDASGREVRGAGILQPMYTQPEVAAGQPSGSGRSSRTSRRGRGRGRGRGRRRGRGRDQGPVPEIRRTRRRRNAPIIEEPEFPTLPARPRDEYDVDPRTDDPLRNKSRSLLAKALATNDKYGVRECHFIVANAIEEAVVRRFLAYNGRIKTGLDYKMQVRCLVFNLKDEKNKLLRDDVLARITQPSTLAAATSEDLANDDRKEYREFAKKLNDARALAVNGRVRDPSPIELFERKRLERKCNR